MLAIYEIKNIQTGKSLAAKKSKVIISDVSDNAAKWQWVPKENSKAWGFIKNVKYEKYLTVKGQLISKCPFGAIVRPKKQRNFFKNFGPSL